MVEARDVEAVAIQQLCLHRRHDGSDHSILTSGQLMQPNTTKTNTTISRNGELQMDD
jgi:hypothetical protein